MQYIAKAGIDDGQFKAKEVCGFDKFEVQLITWDIPKYAECKLLYSGRNIETIHTPLVKGDCVYIEGLIDTKIYEAVRKTCELADDYAKDTGKTYVNVVVHSYIKPNSYEFSVIMKEIGPKVQELLNRYKHVLLCIENVTPFEKNAVISGFSLANYQIVKYLWEHYQLKDRVYTCFDLCHVLISEKYEKIFNKISGGKYTIHTLEEVFSLQKDYVRVIHIAGMRGTGYMADHAIPITETECKPELERFLKVYHKYGLDVPLTLEVNESDYYCCYGAEKTREIIDDIEKGWYEDDGEKKITT